MPITQSRILRLVSAAEHFRDSASTLRAAFNEKCARIFAHTLTFEQAFAELNYDLNAFTHLDPEHTATISTERLRYEITHKRNVVERRRMQLKRHPIDSFSSPSSRPSPPPRRTIAEVVAAVDAEDDAFAGLADLGPSSELNNSSTPSPSSTPSLTSTPIEDSLYFSNLDPATKAAIEAEAAALLKEP